MKTLFDHHAELVSASVFMKIPKFGKTSEINQSKNKHPGNP